MSARLGARVTVAFWKLVACQVAVSGVACALREKEVFFSSPFVALLAAALTPIWGVIVSLDSKNGL